MKERPMLMSAPMVRAILAGTKTQTRRVMNPQPHDPAHGIYAAPSMIHGTGSYTQDHMLADGFDGGTCPYGQLGDRLWVREAWHASRKYDDLPPRDIPNTATVEYDADDYRGLNGRGRPSIHMPRWASRILLEIVSVRVERLNDISDSDAFAEGVEKTSYGCHKHTPGGFGCMTGRDGYRELWESINGPGSWAANPWVWVVEFKRVQP